MRLVPFKSAHSQDEIFINPDQVLAVQQSGPHTNIYMCGTANQGGVLYYVVVGDAPQVAHRLTKS